MTLYDLFTDQEHAVLRERAVRAARTVETDQIDDAGIDILIIGVGSEQYALELQALTAAYRVNVNLDTPIVPVPCVPAYIAGIANIRGHVVPVINLATLLGLNDEAQSEAASLVVAADHHMTVAFRVNTIGDATVLHMAELSPVPETMQLTKDEYVQGTLPDGTILLDVEAILNDPTLVVDEIVH